MKPQTISNWRTRGSQAEPKLIETMCRKLDQDPTPWLLRAQADQAHDPDNVMVWKRMASRLGVSLSAIALFVGSRRRGRAAQAVSTLAGLNSAMLGAMDLVTRRCRSCRWWPEPLPGPRSARVTLMPHARRRPGGPRALRLSGA